jgi:stage IV sporulation protein FB
MSETRSHFRLFGIPVRVEPVFFVIAVLFGASAAQDVDGGINVTILSAWVVVTFVSILVHELGHALTLKVFGQPSEIVLQGLGGVTISHRRLARGRSVAVSLAGSFTALLLLWLPAAMLKGGDWYWDQSLWVRAAVYFTAFANLWWSVANLLPIRPLDGGNVVTELFGAPSARRISLVAAAGGGIWAFQNDQQFAGIFALMLAFQSWQEISAESRAGG